MLQVNLYRDNLAEELIRLFSDKNNQIYQELLHYLLGLLMTDGCLTKSTYKDSIYYRLVITLQYKDSNIFNEMHKYLLNLDKINFYKDRNVSIFSLVNRKLGMFFEDYGICQRKTFIAKALKGIHLNEDFIRGVIDGDGSINVAYKNHKLNIARLCVRLGSASIVLLEQVNEFLELRLGRKFRINVRTKEDLLKVLSYNHKPNSRIIIPKQEHYILCVTGKKAFELLCILYKNKNFFIKRKAVLAQEAISFFESKNASKEKLHDLIIKDYNNGMNYIEIAEKYSINRQSVSKLIKKEFYNSFQQEKRNNAIFENNVLNDFLILKLSIKEISEKYGRDYHSTRWILRKNKIKKR